MTLRWGKRGKLGLVQTGPSARTTCRHSMTSWFPAHNHSNLATMITDPGVAMAAISGDGWTTAPTTDLYINLGIEYLASLQTTPRLIASHWISFIPFLFPNMEYVETDVMSCRACELPTLISKNLINMGTRRKLEKASEDSRGTKGVQEKSNL